MISDYSITAIIISDYSNYCYYCLIVITLITANGTYNTIFQSPVENSIITYFDNKRIMRMVDLKLKKNGMKRLFSSKKTLRDTRERGAESRKCSGVTSVFTHLQEVKKSMHQFGEAAHILSKLCFII